MDHGDLENNKVSISGTVTDEAVVDYEKYEEMFYRFIVAVRRTSGIEDHIPCLISERLYDPAIIRSGAKVKLSGQFRSYNCCTDGKSHLILYVFVKEIELQDGDEEDGCNQISLNGFLCKAPVYRRTPKGKEIADCLVAVNYAYGRSAYIPCICWGGTARNAAYLTVGTNIEIEGRIQSRIYQKENETKDRVAYEVSAFRLEKFLEETI